MMNEREPTLAEVKDAVIGLPREMLERLAAGPLPDPDDCRMCDDVFEPWLYGPGPHGRWEGDPEKDERVWIPGPHDDAILLLIDYHRWWGDPDYHAGRGPEAWRRCQVVYELARDALRGAP